MQKDGFTGRDSWEVALVDCLLYDAHSVPSSWDRIGQPCSRSSSEWDLSRTFSKHSPFCAGKLLPILVQQPIEQVRRIQQKKSAPSLLVLQSKPAGSLLYLILPTLDFYFALIESRNCSRCTPGVRYIYLASLESSLFLPVLPLLDCRPPILVCVAPEGGGVYWKLLSEKTHTCTVVWKTVSPTTSCACMTSTIPGDISMTSHMYIYAR